MAKEKNWNDRWGAESKSRRRGFRYRWSVKEYQDTDTSTHIASKGSNSSLCVLITKSLVKQILMRKALGLKEFRLDKMITCNGEQLPKYPMPNVLINQSIWVSARYINKDVWEFYLE